MDLLVNKKFDIKEMQKRTEKNKAKRIVKEKKQEEKEKKKLIKKINKNITYRIKNGYYTLDFHFNDDERVYKKEIDEYYRASGIKVKNFTYSTLFSWGE